MPNKLLYKCGDRVGPADTIYLEEVPSDEIYRKALFRCGFCGDEFKANISKVKSGNKKSCGCLLNKHKTLKPGFKKHGDSHTRLYITYKQMCSSGKEVCKEWITSYTSFKDWATTNGYEPGKPIVRKDWKKGFSPDNCYIGMPGTQAIKHGQSQSSVYRYWMSLKNYCKKHKVYLASDWENNFEVFRDWAIANNYIQGYQLERRDYSKGFTPDNSYFQSFSKSKRQCWLNGERMSFAEAARRLNRSRESIRLYSTGKLKNIPEGLEFA